MVMGEPGGREGVRIDKGVDNAIGVGSWDGDQLIGWGPVDGVGVVEGIGVDGITNSSFSSLHVFTMLLITLFHFLLTCVYLKVNMHFIYVYLAFVLHMFALRLTHFLYIFKPVVRQLYSLAFTKNPNVLNLKLLDLRQ